MGASSSGSIPTNLVQDKNYYEVPSKFYEFTIESNGRRSLNITETNLLSSRKYNADTNDSRFYCSPRGHNCEPTPILAEKTLIKVKTEHNPSSQSKSVVINFENPLQNFRSSSLEDCDRPLSREDDIIFLENDESNSAKKDSTTLTEKIHTAKESFVYRSIGPDGYERAYSNAGIPGNRLIVFEEDDSSNVRQYAGTNNKYWYCLGCFRSCKKKTQAFEDNDRTFVIPKEHECRPITLEEAKEEQNKIIKKCNLDKMETVAEGPVDDDNVAISELHALNDNEPKSPAPQPETE
uniref:Uncharacterized protein n=1 Tax=Panagrolaimus sp. ES5 TaxID=591445 RepID=A0AC34G3D4_9BILA